MEPEPAPAPTPAKPPPAPEPPISEERAALRDATARLDAARVRVERDAQKTLDETRGKLVEQLLPVLDSLDRAGETQIRGQLETVLRGFGMERFDAVVGAAFDPREHEALAVADVADREQDQRVMAQWEAGYRHAGKLLRPARVQVGRYRG